MLEYVKKNAKNIVICIAVFLFIVFLFAYILYDIRKNIIYQNGKEYLLKQEREMADLEEINYLKLGDLYCYSFSNYDEENLETTVKNVLEEKIEITEEKSDIYNSNKWRIKIPSLKVDAPIVEGTTQESMKKTVGHFEISSKWNGNVALAAHNRGYSSNFFQEIHKLKKGDEIIYCTENGEKNYKVVLNTVIKETDWSYIKQTMDNRITLITCEENKREYRRCIQGVEIK